MKARVCNDGHPYSYLTSGKWYEIDKISGMDGDGDFVLWITDDGGDKDFWWWPNDHATFDAIDEELERELMIRRMM